MTVYRSFLVAIPARDSSAQIPFANSAITGAADVSAPVGARPSTDTLLSGDLYMHSAKHIWLSIVSHNHYLANDIIENGSKNLPAIINNTKI